MGSLARNHPRQNASEGCSTSYLPWAEVRNSSQIAIPLSLGRKPNTREIVAEMHARLNDWGSKANTLMEDAVKCGIPRLAAEVIENVAFIMFTVHATMQLRFRSE